MMICREKPMDAVLMIQTGHEILSDLDNLIEALEDQLLQFKRDLAGVEYDPDQHSTALSRRDHLKEVCEYLEKKMDFVKQWRTELWLACQDYKRQLQASIETSISEE